MREVRGADPLVRGRSPDRPLSINENAPERDPGIARGPGGPPPWFVLLLLCVPIQAQIALYSFDGTTETPVAATYNYGNVSSGDVKDVRFRARNQGNSAIQVTTLTISGTGFSIASVNGVVPAAVAPGNFLEFTARFAAGAPAGYSANLQVNSISVLLLANSIPAAVVTVLPACSPGSKGGVNFPAVAIGSSGGCNFSLANPSTQPLVISTLSLSGDPAFQMSLAGPLTLRPNDAITFSIQFTPVCGQLNYSAALNVNGRTYPLAGAGLTPPLPRPVISFDANKVSSGEQHSISMALPSAAVCAASGNLNLAFAGVVDDGSVIFLSGSTRSLPFAVPAGSTQVVINGQPSVKFQTGTTAGTLTFSVSGVQTAADASTKLAIAPAPVQIETASASNQRMGELDVEIVGFDNTYSAGAMSFTFFDSSGNAIGSAIAADFTPTFKTFYTGSTTGSTFLMRVSFPVQGDQTKVAKVQATLANSAGQVQTGMLTFQ